VASQLDRKGDKSNYLDNGLRLCVNEDAFATSTAGCDIDLSPPESNQIISKQDKGFPYSLPTERWARS